MSLSLWFEKGFRAAPWWILESRSGNPFSKIRENEPADHERLLRVPFGPFEFTKGDTRAHFSSLSSLVRERRRRRGGGPLRLSLLFREDRARPISNTIDGVCWDETDPFARRESEYRPVPPKSNGTFPYIQRSPRVSKKRDRGCSETPAHLARVTLCGCENEIRPFQIQPTVNGL